MNTKNIKIAVLLIALLGGCTAIESAPKHLWSSRWMQRAEENRWICMGSMHGVQIANPLTWIFPYPTRHYFAAKNSTEELPGLSNEWLVRNYMAVFDEPEGDLVYTVRIDIAKNKIAFIGSHSSTKEQMQKQMENPAWKDIDQPWDKSTVTWIKDGMPFNANYCKKN